MPVKPVVTTAWHQADRCRYRTQNLLVGLGRTVMTKPQKSPKTQLLLLIILIP